MKTGKTIETAQRALEILKELMHKKMRVDDILDSFASDEKYSVVYTKEVIYKYFNTFKAMGIKINKEKSTYCVTQSPVNVHFTNDDNLIINLIENYLKATYQFSEIDKMENIKKLLLKNNIEIPSNIVPMNYHDIIKIYQNNGHYKDIITKLEKACSVRQQIRIYYQTSDNFLIEYKVFANKISIEKGDLTLTAFSIETNEMKTFIIGLIKDIEFLPQKDTRNYYVKTAIFNIFNEFSKTYRLKNGEYIKEQDEHHLQIVSRYQNSEALLRRLFRYGENCEILSPSILREAMIEKIKKTSALYENL